VKNPDVCGQSCTSSQSSYGLKLGGILHFSGIFCARSSRFWVAICCQGGVAITFVGGVDDLDRNIQNSRINGRVIEFGQEQHEGDEDETADKWIARHSAS
jgi:hypothetical protein